jgi:Xaa-Pro aminopeptidase
MEQTQPKQLLDYISRDELETRWIRVRREMDCDALIVVQNVDLYYLTGTTQNGVLWFPREGEPLLAVRKSYERAKTDWPGAGCPPRLHVPTNCKAVSQQQTG